MAVEAIAPKQSFRARDIARVSSVLALLAGGFIGWWVADGIVFPWLRERFSNEEVGALWGSRVAAAIAISKAVVDTIDAARAAWKYLHKGDASYDHGKAMFSIATIVFGLVLGFRTFIPGLDPTPRGEIAKPEF